MNCLRKLQVFTLTAMVLGLVFCTETGFAVLRQAAAEAEPEEVMEETPPAVVEEEATVEEVLGPEEVAPTVTVTPTGLVSFDFRDAPIRDVLRLFARQVNVNIVATPKVTGTVSMKLDNVKWRKALGLILEVNQLKMTEDTENNVIKVMTEAEVAAEPLTMKIYHLNYLNAADYEVETLDYDPDGKRIKRTKVMDGAVKKLKPLLAENESIEADAGANSLIVHATPASHDRLQAAIGELDKRIPQVHIEVRFIEASTEATKNLGIKWDFLREYGVEAGGLTRTYEKSIGKLFETNQGASDKSNLSEKTSRSGTTERMTASSSRGYDADLDSGLEWEYSADATRSLSSTALSSFSRDLTRDTEYSSGWDLSRSDATDVLKTATLTADNVRLVVSALLEDSDAKLVSNPKISTVDNKQATIRAVKEWPIPRYSYNGETGTWEINGFDFRDIGITLRVTPHVNLDRFITLDVDPEVSAVVGEKQFEEVSLPLVDTRNAATRVIVKSGETLVIGGLVRTDTVTSISGVPLLKEIPLLGNLFKHTSKQSLNLDLMIFITPTVVEGPTASILAPPEGYLE